MNHWKRFFRLQGRRGFSLVEMSVVLASVAAVTVVTIGGASLVQRSKLSSVVSDIKEFSQAVVKFEDKYKGIPGDIANVTALSGATAGNGNGSIDSATEALQFWTQLSLAGLISGKYDGTSTNVPGTGVPASTIKGSGYNVINPTSISLPSGAIVIELAGFTSSSNSQPILTPDDAKSIDEKLDDGNPNTGTVRATGSSTNCATGITSTDTYNLSNKSLGCRLRFIIRQSAQANDSISLSSNASNGCNQAGMVREVSDSSKRCPTGFIGKITETCRMNSSNVGTWSGSLSAPILESRCQPVMCQGNKKFGEKRVLPCMNGQTGTGIAQTCSNEGVWVTDTEDCTLPSDNAAYTCSPDTTIRTPQACNWGQTGMVRQTCGSVTTGLWHTTSTTCAKITCSGPANVGSTRTYSSGCGSNYTGTATETCAMDGNWKVTSNACAPLYTGTCTPGVTANRSIGCPPGETGSNTQTCIGTDLWTTYSDTCAPVTCDGERVGTARIVKDATCPSGRTGIVTEVCDSSGSWVASYSQCATIMCTPDNNKDGNATWPYAAASTTGASGTCLSGYTGSPIRNCGSDGVWGTVTGSCTKSQCPTSYRNALWPATNTNVQNVTATRCNWPDYEGFPIADCGSDGTWSVKSSCKASDLTARSVAGLQLWLDAGDYSTLYNDTSCTTTRAQVNGTVGCWKDKSGNAYNAIQSNAATYKVNIANAKSSLLFSQQSPFIVSTSLLNSINTGNVTVFITAATNDTDVNSIIAGNPDVASPRFNIHLPVWGTSVFWDFGDINVSRAATAWGASFGAHNVWSFNASGNTSQNIWRNGKNIVTLTTSQTPIYGTSYNLSIGNNVSGYIDEILIYNTALSDTDRKSVQNYLGAKWGIASEEPPIASPALWLDGGDASTIYTNTDCTTAGTPASGGSIGCWKDKSGHSMNFTQTSSLKPVYSIYGSGTNSAVTFQTNSYEYLEKSYDSILNPALNTLFVVSYRVFGLNIDHSAITSRDIAGSVNTGYFLYAGSNNKWMAYSGGGGSSWNSLTGNDIVQQQKEVLTYQFQNNIQTLYQNGVIKGSGTATYTPNSVKPTRVGSGYTESTTAASPFTGDIHEILLYNSILVDSERSIVETYLANKWSVYSPTTDLGLKLWLNAQDSSTIYTGTDCSTGQAPSNGASIGCWKDKSGNSNNAVGSTNLPTYVTSNINSKPALRFNGSNQYLTIGTALLNSINAGNVTVFVVAKTTTVQNSSVLASYPVNTSARFNIHIPWGNSLVYWDFPQSANGRQSTGWGGTAGTPYVWAFNAYSNISQNIWRNGTNIATRSVSATPTYGTTYSLNIGTTDLTYFFNGDIGEILIYNTSLSDANRTSITKYLGSRWGVTVN